MRSRKPGERDEDSGSPQVFDPLASAACWSFLTADQNPHDKRRSYGLMIRIERFSNRGR